MEGEQKGCVPLREPGSLRSFPRYKPDTEKWRPWDDEVKVEKAALFLHKRKQPAHQNICLGQLDKQQTNSVWAIIQFGIIYYSNLTTQIDTHIYN